MTSNIIVSKEYLVDNVDEMIDLIISYGKNIFEKEDHPGDVRLIIGVLITAQFLKIFETIGIEIK